jgi:hypothetical protein
MPPNHSEGRGHQSQSLAEVRAVVAAHLLTKILTNGGDFAPNRRAK